VSEKFIVLSRSLRNGRHQLNVHPKKVTAAFRPCRNIVRLGYLRQTISFGLLLAGALVGYLPVANGALASGSYIGLKALIGRTIRSYI
jgi:hypothetical protein